MCITLANIKFTINPNLPIILLDSFAIYPIIKIRDQAKYNPLVICDSDCRLLIWFYGFTGHTLVIATGGLSVMFANFDRGERSRMDWGEIDCFPDMIFLKNALAWREIYPTYKSLIIEVLEKQDKFIEEITKQKNDDKAYIEAGGRIYHYTDNNKYITEFDDIKDGCLWRCCK